MGATLTAQNTLNSTLGRSQASELFNMRLNASLDGWNDGQAASRSGAAASTSFMDNFTMSEGGKFVFCNKDLFHFKVRYC